MPPPPVVGQVQLGQLRGQLAVYRPMPPPLADLVVGSNDPDMAAAAGATSIGAGLPQVLGYSE